MFSYHRVKHVPCSDEFNIAAAYQSYHIKLSVTSFTYDNDFSLLPAAIYTTPASGIVTISTG